MIEISKLYELYRECSGINTDTRTIAQGQMFFALKGESFDANDFAIAALEAGAKYAVVDRASLLEDCNLKGRLILVDDVLKALQQLALYHREQFDIPVLAVTGTNGKTTTKELITQVLSARYQVVATKGNLNNHIGVPLTLLRIDSNTQLAVVEMGASAPGEIKSLVEIAHPTCGLVTNVGKAHLQGFGSFEGVKKTKGEMYDFLIANGCNIFYNADNDHLVQMLKERGAEKIIPYGLNYSASQVLPVSVENPFLRLEYGCGECGSYYRICTHLIGSYNADNAIAAICVGEHFGVPLEEAAAAIESYVPSNNRSQMVQTADNTLIIDAYNANPTSMRAALANFKNTEYAGKCYILGDMLELGEESAAEHLAIMEMVLETAAEVAEAGTSVFFVGKEFSSAANGEKSEKALFFNTSAELKEYLLAHPLRGRTILIKGSRGTKLETIIPAL